MLLAMFYLVAWGSASSGLVVLNALLLREDGFDYPMSLCSMGLVASWVISAVLIGLGFVKLSRKRPKAKWYIMNTFPVGMFTALSLALGNYAYLFLSVSFIQMLKAAGPCVTLIVLFCIGLERPNLKMTFGVSILSLGTALAAYGEIAFKWTGLFLMLASEICEAGRVVVLQHRLGSFKFGTVEGLYVMTPATLVFLTLGVFVFERDVLNTGHGWQKLVARPHAYMAASLLGFLVNLLTFAVIRTSGSLTLKVCGQLKNLVVILSSIYIFGSMVSISQAIGYSISMIGLVMYQIGKRQNKVDSVRCEAFA